MKKKLKKLYTFCVLLLKSIISLASVLLFNKIGISKKMCMLRRETQKSSVSIIAGGASVKEIISNRYNLLCESDLLVLNNFGNSEAFFSLKPKYYMLLDPTYFDVSYRDEGLNEEGTVNNRTQERQILENLKKVDWSMILFMPSESKKKLLGEDLENKNIKIILYNKTRIAGFTFFQNWMYRHNQGIPSSRNVIIPAMIVMTNIGYNTIYLYGCEFSWTKTMDVDHENGQMFFNDRHFYSKEEIRYFGKGGYKWWLEAIVMSLNATEQVAKYATSVNTRIVNRTKGSFIDAFEYENPDNIK